MPHETGKQRATRIPLEYYTKPDRVQRRKLTLTWWALVIALGWWAVGMLRSDEGRRRYSRGPVTAAHSMWNDDCETCHSPFVHSGDESVVRNLLGTGSGDEDALCQGCHAGPQHRTQEIASEVRSCSACHRDHQGVYADLTRHGDELCVECHADLATHSEGGQTDYRDVSSFTGDHPEFRWVEEANRNQDPGNIRFSHPWHMALGVGMGGEDGFKIGDIASWARSRYQREGETLDSPVQMICGDCHRLDSADFPTEPGHPHAADARLSQTRTSGHDMVPIRFEVHCQGCHDLSFDPEAPEATPLPHRMLPEEVVSLVRAHFSDPARVESHIAQLDPAIKREVRRLRDAASRSEDADLVSAAAALERVKATDLAYSKIDECLEYVLNPEGRARCGLCHDFAFDDSTYEVSDFKPAALPEVWFESARFDHAAHRAVDCRECHAQAYEQPAKLDVDDDFSDQVMMPGIAVCRKCHAPAGKDASGQPVGGARHDCTECHDYHNRTHPLMGRGASHREGKPFPDAAGFISGDR